MGWGSELRRDDAVGRLVAEGVAGRALPDVDVIAVHQLGPEVAAELAGRRRVVFVDARTTDLDRGVRVDALDPATRPRGVTTHVLDPSAVVALAGMLGALPQEVVVVTVPAADVGFGTELSALATAAVPEAVEVVVDLCRASG